MVNFLWVFSFHCSFLHDRPLNVTAVHQVSCQMKWETLWQTDWTWQELLFPHNGAAGITAQASIKDAKGGEIREGTEQHFWEILALMVRTTAAFVQWQTLSSCAQQSCSGCSHCSQRVKLAKFTVWTVTALSGEPCHGEVSWGCAGTVTSTALQKQRQGSYVSGAAGLVCVDCFLQH